MSPDLVTLFSSRFRPLARLLALALAGGVPAACEYPPYSKVSPNPVAYVRPSPTPPFAPSDHPGREGLSPYVAVTIPPPGAQPPGTPVGQSTAGASPAGHPPPIPLLSYVIRPREGTVVTVPAYTAPVYGPAGARASP